MTVKIGEKAPNFGVSEWVQGAPTNFDQEKDHIVLLEVFQVNCPGCFMHAIPEAISIYEKYKNGNFSFLQNFGLWKYSIKLFIFNEVTVR